MILLGHCCKGPAEWVLNKRGPLTNNQNYIVSIRSSLCVTTFTILQICDARFVHI